MAKRSVQELLGFEQEQRVMRLCHQNLQKLNDPERQRRVLKYLHEALAQTSTKDVAAAAVEKAEF